MRLIRPAPRRDERRTAVLMSLAMLVVGVAAIGLMAVLPGDRISGLAMLGIAAALGIGIGLAWLIRALVQRATASWATTWRACWRRRSTIPTS